MARNPQTDGHKAWTPAVMEKFEARWEVGTRQRTAYALALWLGNRVSDVTRLRWADLVTKHIADGNEVRAVEGFEFVQFKGRSRGKKMFLPMTPMLARELAPLSRDTDTVLVTSRGGAYRDGVLAEADASTRQLMEMLGHSNIAFAELYSREASQLRLAVQAMDKVTQVENAKMKAKLRVVE